MFSFGRSDRLSLLCIAIICLHAFRFSASSLLSTSFNSLSITQLRILWLVCYRPSLVLASMSDYSSPQDSDTQGSCAQDSYTQAICTQASGSQCDESLYSQISYTYAENLQSKGNTNYHNASIQHTSPPNDGPQNSPNEHSETPYSQASTQCHESQATRSGNKDYKVTAHGKNSQVASSYQP